MKARRTIPTSRLPANGKKRRASLFAVGALALAAACGDSNVDRSRDAAPPDDSGLPDASTGDAAIATDSGVIDVPPMPMTLRGKVLHSEGSPMSGVTAYIAGSAPVVSDAEGEFTLEDVTAPYDLLLVSDDQNVAIFFVGLTLPSPEIAFPISAYQDVDISGELVAGSGSDFVTTTPMNGRTDFTFRSQNGIQRLSSGSVASPFDYGAAWEGPAAITRTLHVFQYTVTDGVADAFLGHGSAPVGLANGGAIDVGTITMGAVTDQHVAGTVSAPASITLTSITAGSHLSDGTTYFPASESPGPAFDEVVPGVPGAVGALLVQGSVDTDAGPGTYAVVRTGLALPSTDLDITLPAPPVALPASPAENGELGSGTELSLTEAVGVAMLVLRPTAAPSEGGALYLVTTRDRVVVPDTAPFGVTLGRGETYLWMVAGFPDLAPTVDAFVETDVYHRILHSEADGTIVISPPRSLAVSP
jgi:hypothetical protein